jgi:hypothetical protein
MILSGTAVSVICGLSTINIRSYNINNYQFLCIFATLNIEFQIKYICTEHIPAAN